MTISNTILSVFQDADDAVAVSKAGAAMFSPWDFPRMIALARSIGQCAVQSPSGAKAQIIVYSDTARLEAAPFQSTIVSSI